MKLDVDGSGCGWWRAWVRTAEEGHAVVGAEEDGVHVGVPPQQLLERTLHAGVLSR